MMRTIEIIVTPEGKTSVQTRGFTGPSCRQASRFLEDALGQPIVEQRTAEFYQTETVEQSQQERA